MVHNRLNPDQYQILVKSFRRFDCLRRLVESIKYWYPNSRIIVADDSFARPPTELPHNAKVVAETPGVEWFQLPFDVGLGTSRNELVRTSMAEYLILCDDDHIFTEETKIERLIRILEHDSSVGLAAGCVRVNGKHAGEWVGHYSTETGRVTPLTTEWMRLEEIRYRQTDVAHNFYAARREVLLQSRWDPQFKIIGEHIDHFLTFKKNGVKVVYTRNVVCGHWKTSPAHYKKFRTRSNDWKLFLKKWNLGPPDIRNQRIKRLPPQNVAQAFAQQQGAESRNLVILGMDHSGTSVVTQMLAAMGWNLGFSDSDEKNVQLQKINDRILRGCGLPAEAAKGFLSKIPQPWMLKDPRFINTIQLWVPFFEKYEPVLLWVSRDLRELKTNYQKRGETEGIPIVRGSTVEEAHRAAAESFRTWPWGKMHTKYEQILAVARWFDLEWSPQHESEEMA